MVRLNIGNLTTSKLGIFIKYHNKLSSTTNTSEVFSIIVEVFFSG